jgi:hypothetical protein
MDLYTHSPIRLNGVVLNKLSTGIHFTFLYLTDTDVHLLQVKIDYYKTNHTLVNQIV